MIKNKDSLKKELKEKMNKEIDNYIDKMDDGFNGESFPIDEIERLWGSAIKGCTAILQQGTQKIFDSVSEKDLISKKKRIRQ